MQTYNRKRARDFFGPMQDVSIPVNVPVLAFQLDIFVVADTMGPELIAANLPKQQFIAVNAASSSAAQRWAMAHGLARLLLFPDATELYIPSELKLEDVEQDILAANVLAGDIVMPVEEFSSAMEQLGEGDWIDLQRLAQHFGVPGDVVLWWHHWLLKERAAEYTETTRRGINKRQQHKQ